jgi:O-antigen/teichoic acid export membrane protein
MLSAQIARLLVQIGYFVLIARTLGVTGLGELAAALAVVFLLVPFGGAGTGNLLVRSLARDPASFGSYFGYALLVSVASAVLLIVAAVAAGFVLLPDVSGRLMLALAVAELLFGRLCELCGQAFQGLERLRTTAALSLALPIARFVAAAAFALLVASPSPQAWASVYLAASAVAAMLCLAITIGRLGPPTRSHRASLRELRTGLAFSFSSSAALVNADIDKLMLGRLAGLEVVGIYTAAYRAASAALVPIMALLSASYARFFAYGSGGIGAAAAFARRLLPPSVAYGLVAGAGLFALAPVVPAVLGDGYDEAAEALRWLAALPVLQSIGYLAGDALSGSDHQGLRTALGAGAAGINVGLNLLLIPVYSWKGAACATLASFALLAAALWIAVAVLERRRTPVTVPQPRLGTAGTQ